MLSNILSAYIQLLIIVCPIFPVVMFPILTQGMDESSKKKQITIAMGIATGLSFAFLVAADSLMDVFGLTNAGFTFGGSIVLMVLAIVIIFGLNGKQVFGNTSVPGAILGTPIICGPACLIAIGMLSQDVGFVVTAGAIALCMATIWGLLLMAETVSKMLGEIGMEIIMKVSAIYLAAVAGGSLLACL
jgi:multiple antibiotic resistance protein